MVAALAMAALMVVPAHAEAARLSQVTEQLDAAFSHAAAAFEATIPAGPAPEVRRAEAAHAAVRHAVAGFDLERGAAVAAGPGVRMTKALARLDDESMVVGDAATLLLDDALFDAPAMAPAVRGAVRGLVASYIARAEAALASAITRRAGELDARCAALDQLEIDEHVVTCDRLREVHALLA
jgi:hypothetical protein